MALSIVSKATTEQFSIGLEYSAPDLTGTGTITAVETSVSPTGLTLVGNPSIDGKKVIQVISGGTSKVDYLVKFKVTTSAEYIYNNPEKDAILVKVV